MRLRKLRRRSTASLQKIWSVCNSRGRYRVCEVIDEELDNRRLDDDLIDYDAHDRLAYQSELIELHRNER